MKMLTTFIFVVALSQLSSECLSSFDGTDMKVCSDSILHKDVLCYFGTGDDVPCTIRNNWKKEWNLSDVTEITVRDKLVEIKQGSLKHMDKLNHIKLICVGLEYIQPTSFTKLTNLERINASGNKLRRIAYGVFTGTTFQVINLWHNEIEEIDELAFTNMPSLEYLFLSHNRLKSINKNWFNESPLLFLDLRFNFIVTIKSETFENLPKLSSLWLGFNQINIIEKHAFSGLYLKKLHLSGNNITNIDGTHFGNNITIRHLYLDMNHITSLSESFKHSIYSMHTLYLHPNPLLCHCIEDIKKWASMRNIELITLSNASMSAHVEYKGTMPTCIYPDVRSLNSCDNYNEEHLRSALQEYFDIVKYTSHKIPLDQCPSYFSKIHHCPPDQFRCGNGVCLDGRRRCDGYNDCPDRSDEHDCSPMNCNYDEFQCAESKTCIGESYRCDGIPDCMDGSDEHDCPSICEHDEFQCGDNNCIPLNRKCDGINNCEDKSDEYDCGVTKSPCSAFDFTCTDGSCIARRFHCDGTPQCQDYSDERDCGTCADPDWFQCADGACVASALRCDNYYDCRDFSDEQNCFIVIATPDTILVVGPRSGVCPKGFFNEEARRPNECISCFCFGVTKECNSADLFTYHLQPPFDSYKYLGVKIDENSGVVDVRDEPIYKGSEPRLTPVPGRNGVRAQLDTSRGELAQPDVIPYFAMPENYHGNQLKSYGGYIKYRLRFDGYGRPSSNAPDMILTGNGYTLLHVGRPHQAGRDEDISVRFFVGEWIKRSETRREQLATREEIMMALASVENILIKLQYIEGQLDTTIENIEMDSAAMRNTGLGQATYVEECRCPVGYSGLSCEACAPGYSRHRSRPWLGQCYREPDDLETTSGTSAPPTSQPGVAPQPTITVSISSPELTIREVGGEVRFNCTARSVASDNVRVQWNKAEGGLPENAIDDRRGLLVITNLRISDSGNYICQADDGYSVVSKQVNLAVGSNRPEHPRAQIYPQFLEVNEGEPIELQCSATGNPAPVLYWTKANREHLNPRHSVSNNMFVIPNALKTDAGEYECTARNQLSNSTSRAIVTVKDVVGSSILPRML